MSVLSARERWLVACCRRGRRPVFALGFVLLVVGLSYATWAADRQVNTPAADEAKAFDRVVVRSGGIAADPHTHLERYTPSTRFEKLLLDRVQMHADHAARATIFSLRVMLASVFVNIGLVLVAAAIAQAPLLAIIARLSTITESEPGA